MWSLTEKMYVVAYNTSSNTENVILDHALSMDNVYNRRLFSISSNREGFWIQGGRTPQSNFFRSTPVEGEERGRIMSAVCLKVF